MPTDWAVPGSDTWDSLYQDDTEDGIAAEAPDESSVRGEGPLGLAPAEPEPEPEPEPQPVAAPLDRETAGKMRLHSMLRASCEWWDATAESPSAREEWFAVKGAWSAPSKSGEQGMDVLGVPMTIRNKQLQREQEQEDASLAIELSNQDAAEEISRMKQAAADATYARSLGAAAPSAAEEGAAPSAEAAGDGAAEGAALLDAGGLAPHMTTVEVSVPAVHSHNHAEPSPPLTRTRACGAGSDGRYEAAGEHPGRPSRRGGGPRIRHAWRGPARASPGPGATTRRG